MRTVVVLGAGRDQRAIIRAVKAEGYRAVAFDGRADAEARDEADEFIPVSNRDVAAMAAHLWGRPQVSGIITAGSEAAVEVALLSHCLLGCGELDAALTCRDKLEQKYALRVYGVPATAAGRSVPPYSEYVVKPRYGSGSRGVTLNWPREEAEREALAVPAPYGLAQESLWEVYEPGIQISAEALVWGGRCKLVAFVQRAYEITGGRFRELGIFTPSSREDLRPAAEALLGRAAEALGLRCGMIKGDLVATPEGLKVIEVHPRLSPGILAGCVRASTGVDYLREAVRIACGEEPRWELLEPTKNEPCALKLDGTPL